MIRLIKAESQQDVQERRMGRITVFSVIVWVAVLGIAIFNQYTAQ